MAVGTRNRRGPWAESQVSPSSSEAGIAVHRGPFTPHLLVICCAGEGLFHVMVIARVASREHERLVRPKARLKAEI